nr:xaa-Arg dipeptidase-like [Pocillopora verrucosa]
MTGCKVHVEWNLLHYSSVDQADLYQANVKSFGVTFDPQVQQQTWGSPDMGDVSKKIPSNHVLYDIGCKASNHCHAFMAAAMTEYAHAKMLIASKAMAMTAIDILHYPELMQETRSCFKNRTLVHENEDLDATIF